VEEKTKKEGKISRGIITEVTFVTGWGEGESEI
jgi:hypothetical protein